MRAVRRNTPVQTSTGSFAPGQTLTAAELNNFETQSVVVGAPAGGTIAGALNAEGVYVNGVPVPVGPAALPPAGTGSGTVSPANGGQIAQYAAGTNVSVVGGVTVSGDAMVAAGGVLTIQPAAVTYPKMQAASAAQRLLGSAVGATALGEITLGTNLSMTGSTLNATGGAGAAADTVNAAVQAAGTTQGTATPLTAVISAVTTGSGGVALPAAPTAGAHQYVRNSLTSALSLYPASGVAINALAANAPITVPADTTALLVAVTATQWFTVP
jgi:hypothetical protein